MVIGGGISGITAAAELADAGRQVVLIEKEPYLGGHVAGFHNYFPKLCPPSCGLEINYQRIRSNPRISYYTGARVTAIEGGYGHYEVTITLEPRLINNRCTSCGKCAGVCPEEPKAAYIPGGLAFPMKYTIQADLCKKEACGKCLEVCPYDAIQLDACAATVEIEVGKIIIATGWSLYDAGRLEHYHYQQEQDVVTNLEFEHLLAATTRENRQLTRPSDGKVPARIAFIQCAGSRDVNHLPYCSAVCCGVSIKHALTLAEAYPDIATEIFYIDIRLPGRNEKLLERAKATGRIKFTKGKVGRIIHHNNRSGLTLEVEDVMAGGKRYDAFDMVVLAMGMTPNHIDKDLAVNMYGFYLEGQPSGIITASSCKRPMDVSSSVKDATAAALKTMRR